MVSNSIEFFDSGDNFNNFFYLLKKYNKKKSDFLKGKGMTDKIENEINKRDIIIFKVDNNIKDEHIDRNGKLFFPFKKIFIDCKFKFSSYDPEAQEDTDMIINGIMLNEWVDGVIVVTCIPQVIYNKTKDIGVSPTNISFNKSEILCLNEFSKDNYYRQLNDSKKIDFDFKKKFQKEIIGTVQGLLKKIEKKQYTSYEKWMPCGRIKKEIVHSREVSSHKRHLWKDSGKFKIPLLSRKEILSRGYFIDEIVFRDKELRRDVPYLVLNQYTAGVKKEKEKENRVINLMRKKIYRNELLLGKILGEIFPEEIIRHNKTFDKNSRLRLDYNIWDRRIGFEYDGEQHFDKELYQKLYGDGFDEQVKRDKLKDKLCKKKNIKLVRIKYNEPLNKTRIKRRLKEIGVIV